MKRRGWLTLCAVLLAGTGVVVALRVAHHHGSTPRESKVPAHSVSNPAPHTRAHRSTSKARPDMSTGVPSRSRWTLPDPTTYRAGLAAGFPDTVDGAIAAANALTAEVYSRSTSPSLLQAVLHATTTSSGSEIASFAGEMTGWASRNGSTGRGEWTATWNLFGCRITPTTTPSVLDVGLEGTVTSSSGGSGTTRVAWPMRWVDGTWKTTAYAWTTPWAVGVPPKGGWTRCS